MAWILLIVAGLLEVGWAIGLKFTAGFTKFAPSAVTLAAMAGSMWLLGLAVRDIPISTAYPVWTGIGAVGTAILGIILFSEPRDVLRIVCMLLIVVGIVGLRLASRPVQE